MSIPQGYRDNFNTLLRAASNGDLAILECTDAKTERPVIAVVCVSRNCDDYTFTPIAKMFDGNPYDELIPPS